MSTMCLLQLRTITLTIAATLITATVSADPTGLCPPVDLDDDCFVGLSDLSLLAHYWLVDRIPCPPGHLDCDDLYDNGCEVDADTDLSNCGACGHVCSTAHAVPICLAGACTIVACDAGWDSCDGDHDNGCETHVDSDPCNCGVCGHVCSLPHATAACVAGVCTPSACDPPWSDCDGNNSNGCETNTFTSIDNCGACAQLCALPHATTACVAGLCTLEACHSGWANCDGSNGNGCETNMHHTATCTAAEALGTISGNEQEVHFPGCDDLCDIGPSRTARGSRWYWITLTDGGGSICSGMRFRAHLTVPPGTNYYLFLYSACFGPLVASSASGPGVAEELNYAWPSGNRNFWIEVRYISADSPAAQCANWQLQTYGGCPDGIP